MIDTTVKPLRPPLAAPEGKLREAKIPPPKPGAGSPPASNSSPRQDAASRPRRPLTCRECRIKAPWPAAGWYSLDRRIIPGSVPPDILSEAERLTWARLNRQWMRLYCSMACLGRSMERLEGLDRMFREKGIGTRLAGTQPAVKAAGSGSDWAPPL